MMGASEDNALQILEANRKIHLKNFEKYNATFQKQIGDGFLAVFDSVIDAVYACANIQESCKKENINLRIGLHEGEVIFKDNDVYGDEVNITSRIEQSAESGTIYISENIKRIIANKSGMTSRYIKEFDLKNVKNPIKIYALDVDITRIPTVKEPLVNIQKHKKRIILLIWLLSFSLLFFIILNYKSVFQLLNSALHNNQVIELEDKTIAVLPFENLSKNPELEYLGGGIADDIINNLSTIPDFIIIARSSSFNPKIVNASLKRISRDLDVQHIIEGSFQVLNNDIHINISLIHCNSGNVLLSKSYDGQLDDIFTLQDKVAIGITNSLIGSFEKLNQPKTKGNKIDLQAFKFYQMGQSLLKENYIHRNTILESRKLFKMALNEDPDWSQPYIGLAESYFMEVHYGYKSFPGIEDSVEFYISKAININPEQGELYSLRGTVAFWSFDLNNAIENYEKAIDLNPNYPFTYYYLAWADLIKNNTEGCISNMNKAISLDPLNEYLKVIRPTLISFSGEHEKALDLCLKMEKEEPGNNTTLMILGVVYTNMGEYEKALNTLLKRSVGHKTNFMVAYNYAKTGKKEKAREILDYLLQLPEERAAPSTQIGIVYLGLEEYDNAISWFQKGLETKDQWYVWLYQSWSDPIKDDPRFIEILNTMKENFDKS